MPLRKDEIPAITRALDSITDVAVRPLQFHVGLTSNSQGTPANGGHVSAVADVLKVQGRMKYVRRLCSATTNVTDYSYQLPLEWVRCEGDL